MTRIKICCIADLQEALLAHASGADAIGLVGPMPSGPGVIGEDRIAQIAREVPHGLRTFLLSSATHPSVLADQVRRTGTTTLQLVDQPEPGAYEALREAAPNLELVQVIHVTGPGSLEKALRVAEKVDALLLDSGNPSLPVKELGGTGRTHDWSVSRQIVEKARIPVWLAGGLKAENARRALGEVGPYGLDICSGVRHEGKLDPSLLTAFVSAVRNEA